MKQEVVNDEAEEKRKDPTIVILHHHVQKRGLFLWPVGAELVRFLLKKTTQTLHRDMENWFEGAGIAALSGCCNQVVEK